MLEVEEALAEHDVDDAEKVTADEEPFEFEEDSGENEARELDKSVEELCNDSGGEGGASEMSQPTEKVIKCPSKWRSPEELQKAWDDQDEELKWDIMELLTHEEQGGTAIRAGSQWCTAEGAEQQNIIDEVLQGEQDAEEPESPGIAEDVKEDDARGVWAAPTEVAGAPGKPNDPYDSLEEAPEDFWERPNLEKGTIWRVRQRLFVPPTKTTKCRYFHFRHLMKILVVI